MGKSRPDYWGRYHARVHGLKWVRGKLTHTCGLKAKQFDLQVARPKNPESWTKENQASRKGKRYYLKPYEMLDKVTCGKCLEIGSPEGRSRLAVRTRNKERTARKQTNGNPLWQAISVLKDQGYEVIPPAPPPEPEFQFNTEKYPLLGGLFKEFLTWLSTGK